MITNPMQKKNSIADFIKYNNAIPIALGILFFSTSATFAANPAVRDSFYASQTVVQSVDNSYLLEADIEDYPFSFRIGGVTEDDDYLYVAYDFDTIDVVDSVWRDVTKQSVLRLSKALLGEGNLRSYAESELAQVLSQERFRLTETQAYERKLGVSSKVVATEYKGLVGKLIDPKVEQVPQYESQIAKNDPLRVKNPQPLVTWDANAKAELVEGGEGPQDDGPRDYCPDMAGQQDLPSMCAPGATPPAQEPPGEEDPPAEEPTQSEPTPEPEPEPEPEPTLEPEPEPEPQPQPEEEDGTENPPLP